MKYKIKFQQEVHGVEFCECIIDASNEEEAHQKLMARQFTSYLVVKQTAERTLNTEEAFELREIN